VTTSNDFELDGHDHVYRCSVTITGDRTLYQTIHVDQLGSKPDPAPYGGPKGHPVSSMRSTARLIAWEIIGEKRR
jgi:hypothetical protein